MKNIYSSGTLLVAVWALTSISALAQPSSTGPGPTVTTATETPLDGGASLLLAGGVAYGLRKLRARRQTRPSDLSR
ncbi:PID-CTERM protein-sorting domain-containing protein [Hymenobacter terrenus]|uniref:PID-CTERM protein-sorting domain-containing protein n=1 Tax=Hymenobacter terrenus TaxID=1629124 RepID=UPI000619AD57|nr:hypothetical protein [Hymenobacter terrenus]